LDFVKRYPDVRTSNIYKEIKDSDGRLTYFNDFTNYHADFLSGTTRKIQRYGEEGYFKKVFEHFEENLKKSNKLIIVGYGCRDSEINKMIVDNFDFKNRPVFIVDPFPSEHVKSFAAKIGAKIIEKTPDHPLLEDIG
jgi:integrase